MSLIKRGRRRVSITAFAVSLVGYMALSTIGATPALALSSCTFSGGTLQIVQTIGEVTSFSVNETGDILINGTDSTVNPFCLTTVRAILTNTTSIIVTGFTGDEETRIFMDDPSGDLVNWGAINWTVNGASGTADLFIVDGTGLTVDDDLDLAAGVNGVDLNNDGDNDVTLTGIEEAAFGGGLGDDTFWAAGSTATGAAFTINIVESNGFGGNDTIASGAGDDVLIGNANGVNGDTVDYSGATVGVNINTTGGVATGMGSDTVSTFENIVGSGFNDFITGNATGEFITPGAGDDSVDGEAGFDYIDYSDATGDVTVDMLLGTATGNGNDTFSDIEGVQGGDGNDKIIDDLDVNNDYLGGGGDDSFVQAATENNDSDSVDGEGGIDTADYSARTANTSGNLIGGASGGTGETDTYVNVENVRLGSGDDSWIGSAFNNIFFPGGGQNALDGGAGIDSLNYNYGYTEGVTINMAGGGQSGGGQDSITAFENATGTAFNDDMIGTDVVGGTNGANLLVGGKGSDSISANAGPDSVRAGAGNDRIRGGAGDDTLEGQGGNDNIRGSGGADDIFGAKGKDFCDGGGGNDFIKTCEKPKDNHGDGPNGPGLRI